jgi:glycosyltransferase involved in cell wall biosynthesis
MKQPVLFLDQTGSWGGAQRVLEVVLDALEPDYLPLVGLPEDGPFASELRRRGVETLTLPLGRYRSGRKSFRDMMTFPLRSIHCGVRLAQIIRRRNIRLVYINGPRCLLAGVLAARLTGTSSLFHLHLTMTRSTEIFVTERAAAHATKIVACCETAAAVLLKRSSSFARTLQVIYNPVRTLVSNAALSSQREARSESLMNSAHPIVGVVGRICPQKGQHIMLGAAARLRRRGRDVRVVFLGAPDENRAEDATYAGFLKSSARQLGLEERIEWPGYQIDPNPYYAAFQVLVIPSTACFEGLPLAALEAMQWSIPVIGSRIGGIPEIIRDGVNGLLVPPQDEEALADSLERFLCDSALRSRLALGARDAIDSRFSVKTFSSSIRNIVSQLCEPGGTAVNGPQPCKTEVRA